MNKTGWQQTDVHDPKINQNKFWRGDKDSVVKFLFAILNRYLFLELNIFIF